MAIASIRRRCGSCRSRLLRDVLAEIAIEAGGSDGDRPRWRRAAQERLSPDIVREGPDGDAAGIRGNEADMIRTVRGAGYVFETREPAEH